MTPRAPSIVTKLAVSLALAACGGDDATTDPPVQDIAGCDGATLLSKPSDPAARGPWPVGARTITINQLNKIKI